MSALIQQQENQVPKSAPPHQVQMHRVADMLTRYEQKLSQLLPYDSFEYYCDSLDQHFVVGWPSVHRCSYELTLGTLHYGEVVVTRETPFRESELQQLEGGLSDLFRLLRSATQPAD